MELYLDSVDINEIKEAVDLGYLTGLTTTPTFMVKNGVKDIDAAMLELSKMVDILQVEALGSNADEIVEEAKRLVNIGLPKDRTVFKIPVSLEATKACKRLVDEGYMVNLHLVYTLHQAYMAFQAGATYVCPLVGRLQDEGHDALALLKDCVDVVNKYNYQSKIMFSSVRHPQHVKNALNIGVHTITVPWKVMKGLTDNHFTTLGTNQFIHDTRMLTSKVGDLMHSNDVVLSYTASLQDALLQMTKSKLGAVVAIDEDQRIHCIFTDGDLRRMLQERGSDFNIGDMKLEDLPKKKVLSIDEHANLLEAQKMIREKQVDSLVVTSGDQVAGLLDIQDLI